MISVQLTLGEGHSGHLGVDGVEDPLIADLGLGHETDLGAQVGNASSGTRHDHLLYLKLKKVYKASKQNG